MDILFVGHDASRTGAPMVLLHLIRWLRQNSSLTMGLLLQGTGPLFDEFASVVPTNVLWPERTIRLIAGGRTVGELLKRATLRQRKLELKRDPPKLVYANTTATAPALRFLENLDAPVVTHVHELGFSLRRFIGESNLRYIVARSSRFIAVSRAVKENLEAFRIPTERIDLVHEFIETTPVVADAEDCVHDRIRRSLGIPPDAVVVGASGTLDWRKGAELFVQLAVVLGRMASHADIHFVWVGGNPEQLIGHQLLYDADLGGMGGRVHFVGTQSCPIDYFKAMDIFALMSREDPFPLVMLEAASLGKPMVCFHGSGGGPEFIENGGGYSVPYLDVHAMAERVAFLMKSPETRRKLGSINQRAVAEKHDVSSAAPRILSIIERELQMTRFSKQ